VVDMPLDSVPATVSADALRARQQAADGQCHVDVGFWGWDRFL
jgi:allantoinase